MASGYLTPTHISWQPSVNASTHHTDRYTSTELTVRRGQAFTITLYFNRPQQAGEHLAFVTEIGPSPSESHRTRAVFNLSEVGASGWSATQGPSESGYTNFTISSPANAVIGRYNLILQVTSGNKSISRFLGQFVLLFNPWCPGDDVYMANENERQEYVLNENGIIFVGNAKYIEARGWYYGQFQDHLLNVCLTMLDLSLYYRQDPAIDVSRRGDPKYVGRVISSMINGNDNDNGVLLGKWEGSFHSHENPSRWDSSVVILQKWRQDNYKPVQYGQCWVFAGVMCTVLRCLGIPTRLVSNFNSAHDVDRNLSIDKYYDSSGKSLNIGKDSTWDYHVWNESWFVRPDLGSSYNGWQVLDATPQEQSKAIKEGDVNLDYDTLFVYTEVNADCNRWIVYSNGTKKRVYCDTEIIGRFISTKAVGSNSRVDVTYNYKYPEGSPEERRVYKKALAKILGPNITAGHTESPAERSSETLRNPGISGKFKLAEPPVFGKDVSLILILNNLSSDQKTVKVDMSASTVLYTRRAVTEILKATTSVDLGPKQGKHIRLNIPYSYYGKYLTTDKRIQVTALCEVMHMHGVKLLVEKTIILEDTNIIIKIPRQVVVNKAVALEISYANPLPEPVSRCVLLVTLMNQQVKINLHKASNPKKFSKTKAVSQVTVGALGLSIQKCDFKIAMNNNNHHTEEISTERLMVRRGQPFTISVSFSAPVHNYLQHLKRTLLIAQTDGTRTEFPISSLGDQKQWSAALEEQDPLFWTISVSTPANAPVGQYALLLHTSKSDCLLGNFTLLFNPWCRDDEVFLANEAQRQEYILNQEGIIYQGTENAVLAQPWDFGQFEEDIVDICFTLLDIGERHQRDKDHTQRKNPVHICRTVAAMLNCDKLRGILTECGTGQYYNGTPPSQWLGSSPILRQWLASQCKPVRHGQCWALAAVMCSGPSFCGPAPVHAIKEGDTEADYDVCYFFAAINAKCQIWIQKADDTLMPALSGTKYTGNNISTKGVGSERCEDITHNYKYPEGSLQEKEVLDKVYRKIKKLERTSSSETQFSSIPTALEEPVNLFIHLQSESSLLLGRDVPLSIEVFNHSGTEKATHLVVGIQSLHYDGVPITQLWKEEFNFILKSNEANNLQVFVPYSRYREELGENHLLRLTAVLRDEDSYIYFAQEEISICDPPLTIEFPENMVQYQPSTAKISLLNPLIEPLKNCVIVVAGRGLIYRQRKYRFGSVQPQSTQELQIPLTPIQAGPRRLTAHLTCLQLQNLKSYKTIDVAAA
ncbi:erythrocyte membrane protein band 4.2 [Columba guinea]|nr:erythrocyte membrane protein band 4.2 [Columba guinea]